MSQLANFQAPSNIFNPGALLNTAAFLATTCASTLAITNPESTWGERTFSVLTSVGLCQTLPSPANVACVATTATLSTYGLNFDSFMNPESTLPYQQNATEIVHGVGTGVISTAAGFLGAVALSSLEKNHLNTPDLKEISGTLQLLSVIAGPFVVNEAIRGLNDLSLCSMGNLMAHISSLVTMTLLYRDS